MTFCEALDYIHSLLKFGIHPGLSRMDTLLQILGNPHKNIKCVHVAGTNGKGSTSKIINEILVNLGLKVGLFTSPHLFSYTERLKVNNEEISQYVFDKLTNEINKLTKKINELDNKQKQKKKALTEPRFN